jgi:heme/copper-type cytochrome/quinol oxidase subunit 2
VLTDLAGPRALELLLPSGMASRFLAPATPVAQTVVVTILVSDTVLVSTVMVEVSSSIVTASVVMRTTAGSAVIEDIRSVTVTASVVTTLVPVVIVVVIVVGAMEVIVVVVDWVEICSQVEQKELAPGYKCRAPTTAVQARSCRFRELGHRATLVKPLQQPKQS